MTDIQTEKIEEQIAEPEKVANPEPISQPKLKKRRPKKKKKIGFFKLFGYFIIGLVLWVLLLRFLPVPFTILMAVSYTHLDVYKRQNKSICGQIKFQSIHNKSACQ